MTWIDVVSITGTIITLVGVGIAIWQIINARSAAERAERAAIATKEAIRKLDVVVEFSSLIAVLEEVRRLQRDKVWSALPERYGQARKLLINARQISAELSLEQQERLQSSIVNFREMEISIQKLDSELPKSAFHKMNRKLLEDIDEIIGIFQTIRAQQEPVANV